LTTVTLDFHAAEGRVGEDQIEALAGVAAQAVVHQNRALVPADAVQEEVHGAEARRVVHDLPAAQGVELQVPLLLLVELVVAGDVVVSGQEEAPGAAGRVADGLLGLGRPYSGRAGSELLHVVAVGEPVVAENVAVVFQSFWTIRWESVKEVVR
jgi:hypothetical protein